MRALILLLPLLANAAAPPPGCSYSVWSRNPALCPGAASAPAPAPSAPAPKAKDCPARKAPSWVVDGRMCQPVQGRMIPARNAPFGHDVRADRTLRNEGIQRWRCEKIGGVTEWRIVAESCKGR